MVSHHKTLQQVKAHLAFFVSAQTFGEKIKTKKERKQESKGLIYFKSVQRLHAHLALAKLPVCALLPWPESPFQSIRSQELMRPDRLKEEEAQFVGRLIQEAELLHCCQ